MSAEPVVLNPAIRQLLSFFRYKHLPPNLQLISAGYAKRAAELARLPSSPELTVALRKLVESKDCAVRAALPMFEGSDEDLLRELGG